MKEINLVFTIIIILLVIANGYSQDNDIKKTTLQEIKNAPWDFNNKIVEIDIQKILLSAPAGTKSAGLSCEGYGETSYRISDGTEEAFLCVAEDIKLEVPIEVKAKVISRTLCEEIDDIPKTQIAECGKYFPETSRDLNHWYFELYLTQQNR